MRNHESRQPNEIRVILQDIGDPLTRMAWPPTPEGLLAASIEPIRDTAIDVYSYGLYHAGGCTHDSKAYQVIGENIPVLYESAGLQMNEGTKRLIAQGRDPLTIMCEGAHDAGKDFWLRMRMNDLHDRIGQYTGRGEIPTRDTKSGWLEPYYYTPQWKKDHPEWLLGDPSAPAPQFTAESFAANAPNYLHAPIREMMLALASEAINHYDIDGFEIDFIRFPFLFPAPMAWAHRHVMTAFVRKLRALVETRSAERGRPLWFSARVPDTVELAARIGVDLKTWFAEGLLDMCVIGGGYAPFTTPWDNVASLAAAHDIPAKACLNYGAVTKWHWTRTEQGIQADPSPRQVVEQLRGVAARAYAQGVDGFELWNFFYEFPHYFAPTQQEGTHRLGYGFTRDIADREGLANQAKAYLPGHRAGGVTSLYGHVSWTGQVPMMITPATDGIGQTVMFEIADDPGRKGFQGDLWVNIVDLFPEDVIEFEWNGTPLAPRDDPYKGQIVYSNREFSFDVPVKAMRSGPNAFTLFLRERTPRLEPFVTLEFARLGIEIPTDNRS